jgi:hypothetical protein
MPACATHKETTDIPCSGNLILPVPDTDFRDFLDEVDELVGFAPEIVTEIEKNLDTHALKKKRLRLADRKFFESQTGDLPELDITERNMPAEDLDLAVGRPRMSGYAVYLFLMLHGFLGSLTSKKARRSEQTATGPPTRKFSPVSWGECIASARGSMTSDWRISRRDGSPAGSMKWTSWSFRFA